MHLESAWPIKTQKIWQQKIWEEEIWQVCWVQSLLEVMVCNRARNSTVFCLAHLLSRCYEKIQIQDPLSLANSYLVSFKNRDRGTAALDEALWLSAKPSTSFCHLWKLLY